MRPLNGIHHISAITADATQNLAFYTGVMGLRLVKKTVNQDNPTVYHLFYADEDASPGADLTFFEYPGLARGRAGAGMIHRIAFRVGSDRALDFWAKRLASAGIESAREDGRLRFEDPEGLGFALLAEPASDAPLVAWQPEIPEQLAAPGVRVPARAGRGEPQAAAESARDKPSQPDTVARSALNSSVVAGHERSALKHSARASPSKQRNRELIGRRPR